jgi:hypothetical protein
MSFVVPLLFWNGSYDITANGFGLGEGGDFNHKSLIE